MSEDLKQIGHVMRIGIVVLIAPASILSLGFFLWEEMYLYAAAMTVFLSILVLGVYMNWRRLSSDERIDDERMMEANRKAGFNAFWTVINTSVVLWFFRDVVAGALTVEKGFLVKYDLSVGSGSGFHVLPWFRNLLPQVCPRRRVP